MSPKNDKTFVEKPKIKNMKSIVVIEDHHLVIPPSEIAADALVPSKKRLNSIQQAIPVYSQ